jgi:hypothetical protein
VNSGRGASEPTSCELVAVLNVARQQMLRGVWVCYLAPGNFHSPFSLTQPEVPLAVAGARAINFENLGSQLSRCGATTTWIRGFRFSTASRWRKLNRPSRHCLALSAVSSWAIVRGGRRRASHVTWPFRSASSPRCEALKCRIVPTIGLISIMCF